MAKAIDQRKFTANILTLARRTAATMDAAILASAKAYTDAHGGGGGGGGGQPLDATLTALAALDGTPGLLEETALDTFVRRAIGVGAGTSILTRADGDARYDAVGAATAAGIAAIAVAEAASQPLDPTLSALAGLSGTLGLVEETAADVFTKRALGVGAGTSVLTRADGDARYDALGIAATDAAIAQAAAIAAAGVAATAAIAASAALALQKASNLSDVASAATSRTNLGLGAMAVKAAVAETDLSFTDITTANASITQHGLLPKLPNDATKYLDGTGIFSVPGAGVLTYPFTSATGLLVRYNASLSGRTLSNRLIVTQWLDISGSGHDTLSNTTNGPKWIDAGFLGKFPALYFNIGQRLMVNGMPSLGSPLACTIIFVVMNCEASGNSHVYNWAGQPIGFGSSTPLDFMYNGTLPAAHGMSAESNNNVPVGISSKHPAVCIHTYNGASSVQTINGIDETKSPGTTATGSTNNFTIGSDSSTGVGGAGVQACRMLLAEIAVLNFAVNSTQRAALNTYYKTLYGMTF